MKLKLYLGKTHIYEARLSIDLLSAYKYCGVERVYDDVSSDNGALVSLSGELSTAFKYGNVVNEYELDFHEEVFKYECRTGHSTEAFKLSYDVLKNSNRLGYDIVKHNGPYNKNIMHCGPMGDLYEACFGLGSKVSFEHGVGVFNGAYNKVRNMVDEDIGDETEIIIFSVVLVENLKFVGMYTIENGRNTTEKYIMFRPADLILKGKK